MLMIRRQHQSWNLWIIPFYKIQLNEGSQQYEHTNIMQKFPIRVYEVDIPPIMVCGLNSVDY
jgi:hypothetical protein